MTTTTLGNAQSVVCLGCFALHVVLTKPIPAAVVVDK